MRTTHRFISLLVLLSFTLIGCTTKKVYYPVAPTPVVVTEPDYFPPAPSPVPPVAPPVTPPVVAPPTPTPSPVSPAPVVGVPTKAAFDQLVIGRSTYIHTLSVLGQPVRQFSEAGVAYSLYRVLMPNGAVRDAELQFRQGVLASKLVGF